MFSLARVVILLNINGLHLTKITEHPKKQENTIHNYGKKSIETYPEMSEIMEFSDRDIKTPLSICLRRKRKA